MPQKQWMYVPDSGGVKIPDAVKPRIRQRIQHYADEHFAGRFTRLDIRFRSKFCYIDAYTDPEPSMTPNWPPADFPETREEYIERLRNTPLHLCRLRYYGSDDRWAFAFYAYSGERYEASVFPDGEFEGMPEAAFAASANAYL